MRKLMLGFIAVSMSLPVVATPADAQYRARTQRYHHVQSHRCFRGNGTSGALIGGGTGALIGAAVTHGIAGPIVGAAGGALLGRHVQRHARC